MGHAGLYFTYRTKVSGVGTSKQLLNHLQTSSALCVCMYMRHTSVSSRRNFPSKPFGKFKKLGGAARGERLAAERKEGGKKLQLLR